MRSYDASTTQCVHWPNPTSSFPTASFPRLHQGSAFLSFFLFGCTGVSHPPGRHSTTWVAPPSSFAFFFFSGRVLCFFSWGQLWTLILLPIPPCSWDHRRRHHHTQLVVWDGVLLASLLELAWTSILLISASQMAGITQVHHHLWPSLSVFRGWHFSSFQYEREHVFLCLSYFT
jgi:hypothetical protein